MPFNEMYKQNYHLVYQLANKMVNDEEISKDITQEVFIKLYKAIHDGQKFLNIQSWLYRVTANSCYNHHRIIRKNGKSVGNIQVHTENEPETSIIEQEVAQQIRNLMLRLKEKEQLILTLYSEGMSYKEIAEASGIPFNSVGTTLTRALSKLKKLCHDNQI